jgi:dihydrofolate reductase
MSRSDVRRLVSFIGISLDGFYEGPNQEFDFFVVDDEFDAFSVEQLDAADGLVFGRVTYSGMAQYWPSPEARRDNPAVATRMNSMPKVVVSSTLDSVSWNGSTLLRGSLEEGMRTLKSEPGRELLVLGSPRLTGSLAHLGLLDELRIMVNPVALGRGKSLFDSTPDRLNLQLLSTRRFRSGTVLLTYHVPSPR